MAYKNIKEKITLEKGIKSYEPDASAYIRVEITGLSKETEEKIREEFSQFWQKTKANVETEVSCGAG